MLLDEALDPIAVLTLTGELLEANRQWRDVLGCDPVAMAEVAAIADRAAARSSPSPTPPRGPRC